MHLEQIAQNLDRRQIDCGIQFDLQSGASNELLCATEERLGVRFPPQVTSFYLHHNGLMVEQPRFVVLALEDLEIDDQSHIHFATADFDNRICFDSSKINEAEQWDIIEPRSGERITFTMASFWTNKIWKWIDRRIEFWNGDC